MEKSRAIPRKVRYTGYITRRRTLEDKIHIQVERFVEELEAMKLGDIKVLDISGMTPMCDYFIIATVVSSPQTKAAISRLLRLGKEMGVKTRKVEGDFTSRWVLCDFGDFIVHLMEDEERIYYNLEEIWKRKED